LTHRENPVTNFALSKCDLYRYTEDIIDMVNGRLDTLGKLFPPSLANTLTVLDLVYVQVGLALFTTLFGSQNTVQLMTAGVILVTDLTPVSDNPAYRWRWTSPTWPPRSPR
jgi:hypothetical protein